MNAVTKSNARALDDADTAQAEADPVEDRVTAFTVAGKAYTIPAHIPPGWALTYLRLRYSSSTGEDWALIWMLTRLLGDRQMLELEVDPNFTAADRKAAIDACRVALLGDLEDPKGL